MVFDCGKEARMQHVARNSEFSLSPSELSKLVRSAGSTRDRIVLLLFMATGMRRAELQQLRKEDIDRGRCRAIIRNGKGNKQRIVYLPTEIVSEISSFTENVRGAYLFPGRNGGPLSLRSINNIDAGVGECAGLVNPNPRYRNINPHLLRHTFARIWKRQGGSLESLQKILGHASMSTTLDLYGRESQEETEQNYRHMERYVLGAYP
jgi:integrase